MLDAPINQTAWARCRRSASILDLDVKIVVAVDQPSGMIWRVRGRVQGVGYRAFCRRQAVALGLKGWARNLPDGSVEVVAWGMSSALVVFEERLRTGPRHARVDAVDASMWRHEPAEGFTVS